MADLRNGFMQILGCCVSGGGVAFRGVVGLALEVRSSK